MNWFQGLSLREKLVVVALVLVGVGIVADLLLFSPYRSYRAELQENLVQAREDLQWMERAVSRIADSKSKPTPAIRGNIATYADGQIARAGLKQQLQQMTPIQRHSVRIRLSDVEFARLLRFFSSLNPSISVEEMRILPASAEGTVDASMVLRNLQAPA